MPPSKEAIERQFDASAADYDRAAPSIFGRFGARLAEQVPLATDARVLDVATGTGAALLPVARRLGPGGSVTGIDLSAGMLAEAARAVREEGLSNVHLLKMDAERLDFPDNTFDAVLSANSIFLFPDRDAALREMHRVMKPGGVVALSIFGNTPPAFMPAWGMLCAQLKAYGVTVFVPDPLAYLTEEEMAALLTRAGFHAPAILTESTDVVYEDAESWWRFLLTMAPRPAIMSMDGDARTQFTQEYLAELHPFFGLDGICLPVSTVYARGRR